MADVVVPLPTVRTLLAQPGLGLRLLSDSATLPAGALAREAPWVHSSDLADPAPFLVQGVVLLTTGTQFLRADDEDALWSGYVRRLVGAGVVALGFGTEVIRDGVPRPLLLACAEHGLPLFEVPFQTPFIAVARANAESVTQLAFARRSWALVAQRAIARAALQAGGLAPTVQELSRQMQAWVGLFDVAGSLAHESLPRGSRPSDVEAIEDRARALLARQSRATSVMRLGGQAYTLQTVGRGHALRGVLAVASDSLDHEAQAVMNSVVAMVGLASEQDAALTASRLALRNGVLRLMLAGEVELARSVADGALGGLPPFPAVVARGRGLGAGLEAVSAWISALPERTAAGLFLAADGDDAVLVAGASGAEQGLDELRRRFGGRWGVSEPVELSHFPDAAAQAHAALERGAGALTRFADVVGLDLIGSVRDPHARTAARAVLQPLIDHDELHGTALLLTLCTWLRHDGHHEGTAAELGVHRHTVRARLRTAEHVGGHRLDSFTTRAELWAALRLAGMDGAAEGPGFAVTKVG